MPYKKFGALTSSQNPEELANRVKGAVLACSSIIIFFAAQFFKIQLTTDNIVELATQFSAIAGAVWTIYGFILSGIAYFAKK